MLFPSQKIDRKLLISCEDAPESYFFTAKESILEDKKKTCTQAFIQPIVYEQKRKGAVFFLPALLGEGYFSYRHLAGRMAAKFDQNIYGLSDPGITDKDLLPESLEHAAGRYILAIKTIQAQGPYQLLGFSFGSTLAYEVAKQLLAAGEKVSEVHLVDGFPPYLYQSLSAKAHADLLEALINFMIDTLNNRFYAEQLKHIKLTNFARLDKEKQIELSFSTLEKKLSNPVSKNMLNTAKRHLMFSLQAAQPHEKLPIWPTFYLTDVKQKYLSVINQIPGISKNSADYHYFYWSRYFCNLTRNKAELDCDHLSLLRAGPSTFGKTAETFWRRSHDLLMNFKLDHLGPHAFYRLEPIDDAQAQLSIFFLNYNSVRFLVRDFKSMGLSPKVILHDKFLKNQADTIYTSQANLFVQVPNTALNDLSALMERTKIKKQISERQKGGAEDSLVSQTQSGFIDLIVFCNRRPLLNLSFKYHSLPKLIIESFIKRMGPNPDLEFRLEDNNLLVQHSVIVLGGTLFYAIEQTKSFLADFISVLQVHMDGFDTDMADTAHHASVCLL